MTKRFLGGRLNGHYQDRAYMVDLDKDAVFLIGIQTFVRLCGSGSQVLWTIGLIRKLLILFKSALNF